MGGGNNTCIPESDFNYLKRGSCQPCNTSSDCSNNNNSINYCNTELANENFCIECNFNSECNRFSDRRFCDRKYHKCVAGCPVNMANVDCLGVAYDSRCLCNNGMA